MRIRLRDAILAVSVGAALIATGEAVHDLGRRLPPPPPVHTTPAPSVAPDSQYH